jgi:hypothetical protein
VTVYNATWTRGAPGGGGARMGSVYDTPVGGKNGVGLCTVPGGGGATMGCGHRSQNKGAVPHLRLSRPFISDDISTSTDCVSETLQLPISCAAGMVVPRLALGSLGSVYAGRVAPCNAAHRLVLPTQCFLSTGMRILYRDQMPNSACQVGTTVPHWFQ